MTCPHEVILGGPCRLCGRRNHMPLTCEQAEEQERAAIDRIVAGVLSRQNQPKETEVTTKVRITNIVEDGNAHSNGDVVIHGLSAGRLVLRPGESHEEWLKHSDLPEPIVITERWPSQAK